jgi:hypothetical protein
MNRTVMIAVAAVTAYMVWLIVFVLVVEPRLRRVTGRLFGVSIERELHRLTGPSSNVSVFDVFDAYSWRVDGPASLSVRFGVGLLRLAFWLAAVGTPILLALVVYVFAFKSAR